MVGRQANVEPLHTFSARNLRKYIATNMLTAQKISFGVCDGKPVATVEPSLLAAFTIGTVPNAKAIESGLRAKIRYVDNRVTGILAGVLYDNNTKYDNVGLYAKGCRSKFINVMDGNMPATYLPAMCWLATDLNPVGPSQNANGVMFPAQTITWPAIPMVCLYNVNLPPVPAPARITRADEECAKRLVLLAVSRGELGEMARGYYLAAQLIASRAVNYGADAQHPIK
ncbi:hypothetical protein U1Q18_043705 [Sarracenia purpurea var. burkii]